MTTECPDVQRVDCAREFESLGGRVTGLTEQQQSNSKKLDAIHESIVGTGEKPGLAGRVRSLEELESRRSWLVRAIVVAVLGLIAKSILGCVLIMAALSTAGCLTVNFTYEDRDAALDAFCPDGHCPIVKIIRAVDPNPFPANGPAIEPWEIQP